MRNPLFRSLALAAAITSLAACGYATCDEDHSSVTLARNISGTDWAQLVLEAEALAKIQPSDLDNALVKTPLPEFQLSPLRFQGYSNQAFVKLAGCFDHGVYISLDSLNTPQGRVALSWGEGPTSGKQVLWSRHSEP